MNTNPNFVTSFFAAWLIVPAAFYVLAACILGFFYKLNDEVAAQYAAENAAKMVAATAAAAEPKSEEC